MGTGADVAISPTASGLLNSMTVGVTTATCSVVVVGTSLRLRRAA